MQVFPFSFRKNSEVRDGKFMRLLRNFNPAGFLTIQDIGSFMRKWHINPDRAQSGIAGCFYIYCYILSLNLSDGDIFVIHKKRTKRLNKTKPETRSSKTKGSPTRKTNTPILAFDKEKIHAGNRGLEIDHESVQQELERLLGKMTLEQKRHELHGWQPEPIDGFYYAGGDEALGILPYKMADGPRGARVGRATAFPVPIARGATFDPDLEKQVGVAIGLELAEKGGNVLLAPTMNLLRHPGWGRAQETYSEDTFHLGAMAVAFVSGAQNHVLACPKHFALNNLEMTRFDLSSNIDARSLHEVYLPHFRRCVKEGAAGSIMSAYNKMNGVYCGEQPILLSDILRDDWGFTGFVVSDWFLGTRSTGPALNAGMDLEMPAAYWYAREKIDAALDSGEIDIATITRNASHLLYQKLAWQAASIKPPAPGNKPVTESEAHLALSREVAEKSFVLLKNNDLLPLVDSSDLRIAVVGELADTVNLGDRGSSFVSSTQVTTPWQGLVKFVNQASLEYFGTDDDLSRLSEFDLCILVVGLTYIEEGEFIPTLQQEAEGKELARGGDRQSLRLPEKQEKLIAEVTRHTCRSLVLLEGGSAIEVTDWVDSVDALLMLWYPGAEGGHAVARTLFGEVNPSGKLPVTFPLRMAQLLDWDTTALDITHDLFHGYRYLDRAEVLPCYAFGFGLSYTRFTLEGFQSERVAAGFRFILAVRNVGALAGAAVPQVYVSYPGSKVLRAVKELKGFGKVELAPGDMVELAIDIADSELMYFDDPSGKDDPWRLEPCEYQFNAGFASDDLPLASSWTFDGKNWVSRYPLRIKAGEDDNNTPSGSK